MPTDQEILDEQNRRLAAETAARQAAVGNQTVGAAGSAAGGITDPTTGLSKLWKGVKSSIGGQSSYQPGGYRLDQTQANLEMQLAGNARANQSLLGNQLQAQIQGNGPTVAAQQAKFGIAEALRNAGTQAANARGVNRGMALRESMYAGQNAQEAANRDAAMLRASEQLGAMGQYGGLTSQQRSGDIQSRQVSLDAEKANQQAEMQRQGYQTQLADANATRAQKGTGAVLSSIGSVVKGLSDIRAKESIEPIEGGSFAERLASVRKADDDELARRAEAESNARISAMLASSSAGYGAQQASLRNNETNGLQPTQGGGGLMDQVKSQGVTGAVGGGLENLGNGLMSDQKSKERIRFLEGELYGRPRRELDQQNPYRPDYLSEAERAVENGFDARRGHDPSRPIVQNRDGSYSTENTIGFETDGRHIVIPTIVGGKQLSDDEAIRAWRSGTNKAVGDFADRGTADSYAKKRHTEESKLREMDSKSALRGVRPYSFRYRPQYAELMAEQGANMAPPGQKPLAALQAYDDARTPRPGVMAQDLEQTREGSKVVDETPVGKVLDMKRSVAFALANAADMNRRLARLEGARK